jgi:hypothetical protein
VFFLSETHLAKAKAEKVRRKLGCDHLIIFESDGRSGGLLLLWKNEVQIVEQGVTENYIDVLVQGEVEWRLTGVYGEPKWEEKKKTWMVMRGLKGVTDKPWIALGDFNEILYSHEKEGGRERPQRFMQAFHDALIDCELSDMGFTGDKFTWQRGKVRERLDRGVTNTQWNILFPGAGLENGEKLKSDHRPLIVDTEASGCLYRGAVVKQKRFEARWLKEETVQEIVSTAWARACATEGDSGLMNKAKAVHEELHVWDREVLKGPVHRLKRLKHELEKRRRGPMSDDNMAAQKELLLSIELLMEQEELVWIQRARLNWLKHGDRNTNFFQHYATSRKRRNAIKSLVDEQGARHENINYIKQVIKSYFDNLFSAEVKEAEETVFADVQTKISQTMNEQLLSPFTLEEVKKALFSIGDLKAPGPDGLHAIFYKRFWSMLGEDLVKEVLHAVNTRVIPEGWNNTTIVLIPKVKTPEKVSQFRPISLCNVVYKVI